MRGSASREPWRRGAGYSWLRRLAIVPLAGIVMVAGLMLPSSSPALATDTPNTGDDDTTAEIAPNPDDEEGQQEAEETEPPAEPTMPSEDDSAGESDSGAESAPSERARDISQMPSPRASYAPVCMADYVYGISANGQLQQVDPSHNVTDLGTRASRVSSFNGLGIGTGGETVLAYERGYSNRSWGVANMYSYDPATGTWANTGDSYDTTQPSNGNYRGSLIAGAIDLSDDTYMFGGFETEGSPWTGYSQVFKIWKYDPAASPKFHYVGYIRTDRDANTSANGDMAFDAAGNLFVVRGSGNTTTVFSVTAANLASANGGEIRTSGSNSFPTMSDVNGVAFDASGKAYLGAGSSIGTYDMPGWDNGNTIVSRGYSGTDLASCSSPPTVVIEKEIIGERVSPDDQFHLTLNQGRTELGQATTTGTDLGVQQDRIGPLPTARNVELTFAETGANGTDLTRYASAYQCTVTHLDGMVENLGQVDGTSGSITIPASGDAVRCVFRNTPLVANVTVHKDVTDDNGENPAPREGWTVGASASATNGSVSASPSSSTQTTNADGDASWSLTFGDTNDRATVNISEAMDDGYQFLSGSCLVTKLNGEQTTTDLTGPDETSLTGVAPGDRIDCGYVNRPTLLGVFSVEKTVDGVADASLEYSGEWSCTLDDSSVTGTWGPIADGETWTSTADDEIPLGARCSVTSENDPGPPVDGDPSYSWDDGSPAFGEPVTAVETEGAPIPVVTVTNISVRALGSVGWAKVDAGTGEALANSVWSLDGPDLWDSGNAIEIEDCVADSAEQCTGPDQDPAAGSFQITDLAWGDYELTETSAPAGYYPLNDPVAFEIGDGNGLELHLDLGEIENTPISGPPLPFTGGLGREFYTLLGLGVLVLGAGVAVTLQIRRNRREAV